MAETWKPKRENKVKKQILYVLTKVSCILVDSKTTKILIFRFSMTISGFAVGVNLLTCARVGVHS